MTQLAIAGAAVAIRHAVAQKLSSLPLNSSTRLKTATTHVAVSSARIKLAVDMRKSSPQILFPKAYVNRHRTGGLFDAQDH